MEENITNNEVNNNEQESIVSSANIQNEVNVADTTKIQNDENVTNTENISKKEEKKKSGILIKILFVIVLALALFFVFKKFFGGTKVASVIDETKNGSKVIYDGFVNAGNALSKSIETQDLVEVQEKGNVTIDVEKTPEVLANGKNLYEYIDKLGGLSGTIKYIEDKEEKALSLTGKVLGLDIKNNILNIDSKSGDIVCSLPILFGDKKYGFNVNKLKDYQVVQDFLEKNPTYRTYLDSINLNGKGIDYKAYNEDSAKFLNNALIKLGEISSKYLQYDITNEDIVIKDENISALKVSTNITEKNLALILKEFLTWIRDDEGTKEFINKYAQMIMTQYKLQNRGQIDYDINENNLYDDFKKGIDNLLKDLNEENAGDEKVDLDFYISKKNKQFVRCVLKTNADKEDTEQEDAKQDTYTITIGPDMEHFKILSYEDNKGNGASLELVEDNDETLSYELKFNLQNTTKNTIKFNYNKKTGEFNIGCDDSPEVQFSMVGVWKIDKDAVFLVKEIKLSDDNESYDIKPNTVITFGKDADVPEIDKNYEDLLVHNEEEIKKIFEGGLVNALNTFYAGALGRG